MSSYTDIEFCCPSTKERLTHVGDVLESASGARYPVIDQIPDFVAEPGIDAHPIGNQEYYRSRSAEYDRGNDVMYRMLLCEEDAERNFIIDELRLSPGDQVLETGCGTCRDTVHLLERGVRVHASDISGEMLSIGKQRLKDSGSDLDRATLFRADAMKLPFKNGAFDSAFHFGGLNLFPDPAAALVEMARVVKVGGRVVAGDEGVAPWLTHTEFGKILINSNPLFEHSAPIKMLPPLARNVSCRWVLNSAFYILSFDVGEGEPQLDLDIQFPGWRGGSHRSRYFGRLEGVAPRVRDAVIKRAAAEGMSISAWLEETLDRATSKDAP